MKGLVIAILVALAAPAAAQPVVLAIDGDAIYVELGAKDGVGAGSELELLHEIVAKDPRSGVVLRDRFSLGTITVVKSGAKISIAKATPELAKRVLAGDQVRLTSGKRTFVDPWQEQVDAGKQPPPTPPVVVTNPVTPPPKPGVAIDHAAIVTDAWQRSTGKTLLQRVELWTAVIAADPGSPYRRAIETELASLRLQIDARKVALETAAKTGPDRQLIDRLVEQLPVTLDQRRDMVITAPIERAVPGQPIQLALLLRSEVTTDAYLFVKGPGEPGFSRSKLWRDGDAHLRGTIAATHVKVGTLAWYVEIGNTAVLGAASAPRTIAIEGKVAEEPIAMGRTHIDGHVDYVDFDGGLGKGYDQYVQAELDFAYRFLDPVYAVRLGFGTLSGTGGPKDVIDLPSGGCIDEAGVYRCRRVTFSYVYTELEFKVRENIALMIRPQAGLLTTDTMDTGTNRCGSSSDTAGCRYATPFGVRGRVRFGAEQKTNLVLGAAFTADVGTLLEAAYTVRAHPMVPVQMLVQVTDMPVIEDFGVRLILDVGFRRYAAFYPSARVSYQARDIDHSGISGGFALNFDW